MLKGVSAQFGNFSSNKMCFSSIIFENGERDLIHLGGEFMKVYGFTNLQAFL